jgi:uncharacterized protein with NRDE domain
MCLLVLAWRAHPRYRLVVAANRDEYHARPAAPLARWPPPAELLAGRDLQAGGAWLGLDRARRFGVVTNFRELQRARAGAPSRGSLIPRYLGAAGGAAAAASAAEFFAALEKEAPEYSGFNLLLTDRDSLWYGSNRARPFARRLQQGVYGLSNELLDTPWPKLERVRAGFETWLRAGEPAAPAQLFALLGDRTPAQENALTSEGGLPRDWQRALSAPFVLHPQYGTRCSSVLLLEGDGRLYLAERRFDARGEPAGETEFHLDPGAWP